MSEERVVRLAADVRRRGSAGRGPVRGASSRAVAIMFTDIERFTETTERLGDEGAHRLLREHNLIVRARVTGHDGREVKSTGDGFLTTFPSVAKALACACAIQSDLEARNAGDEVVRVRVGLHAGKVIREGADVHGWNVILASRVADEAQGGEVLVSSIVRAMAPERYRFGEPREVGLEGMSDEHLLHPLLWRDADVTSAPRDVVSVHA